MILLGALLISTVAFPPISISISGISMRPDLDASQPAGGCFPGFLLLAFLAVATAHLFAQHRNSVQHDRIHFSIPTFRYPLHHRRRNRSFGRNNSNVDNLRARARLEPIVEDLASVIL